MVHDQTIGKFAPSARGQAERAGVYGVYKSATDKDAGRHTAIEELVYKEGCDDLQDEKPNGQTDTLSYRRYSMIVTRKMIGIRFRREFDDGLQSHMSDPSDGVETIKRYLDEEGTGHLGGVTDSFANATRPEPPFNTIIHCVDQTGLALTVLFPPLLLARIAVSTQGPMNTFEEARFNFTTEKACVVLRGSFTTPLVRGSDFVANVSRSR